jgi:hypothetical protein
LPALNVLKSFNLHEFSALGALFLVGARGALFLVLGSSFLVNS